MKGTSRWTNVHILYFYGFIYSILYILIYEGCILCNYLYVVFFTIYYDACGKSSLYTFVTSFSFHVESKVIKITWYHWLYFYYPLFLYFCNTSLIRLARTISDHHLKWNLVLCGWNHETHRHQLISPSGMVSLG